MNERIRELAKQTDIWCDQNWHNQSTYDLAWEDKFAELIVQECMKVTVNYPHPQTKLTAAEHIARHFGVE